jgi:hypothetical protein
MTENNISIEKSIRLPVKKIGMAAKIANAEKAGVDLEKVKNVNDCINRLGLIFDDSGSMSITPLQQAKDAVDTFLKNCNPADTAIAVYPLCFIKRPLICNFAAVMISVLALKATGSTPLYTTLKELIDKENITRAIAFSDGGPTDDYPEIRDNCINLYITKKIPVDTIYIGSNDNVCLKELSDKTGGIYLKFTDMASLKAGLKYLTPAFRAMLMSGDNKEKLEKGELE